MFGSTSDFDAGTAPESISLGDFNGDGKLDVVIASSGANAIGVFLGNGDGTFGRESDFQTGTDPVSIVLGDFNGDGNLDVAVANTGSSSVSVLLGQGDGGFSAKLDFATGNSPRSLAVGDFNGDGKLDLVTANATDVSVALGNGDGTFAASSSLKTDRPPLLVDVGDFKEDGKLDLIVAELNDGGSAPWLGVFPGLGNGSFGAELTTEVSGTWAPFDTGSRPEITSLAVADLDDDHHLDVMMTMSTGGPVEALGWGNGTFGSVSDFGPGVVQTTVKVADLTGDHRADVVFANAGDFLEVYLAQPDGGYGVNPGLASMGAGLAYLGAGLAYPLGAGPTPSRSATSMAMARRTWSPQTRATER